MPNFHPSASCEAETITPILQVKTVRFRFRKVQIVRSGGAGTLAASSGSSPDGAWHLWALSCPRVLSGAPGRDGLCEAGEDVRLALGLLAPVAGRGRGLSLPTWGGHPPRPSERRQPGTWGPRILRVTGRVHSAYLRASALRLAASFQPWGRAGHWLARGRRGGGGGGGPDGGGTGPGGGAGRQESTETAAGLEPRRADSDPDPIRR